MLEFRHPIPVVTSMGEGYAVYVTNSGGLANDVWLVVLDDGRMRHFTTEQLTYVDNGTLGIKQSKAADPDRVVHMDNDAGDRALCGANQAIDEQRTRSPAETTCSGCYDMARRSARPPAYLDGPYDPRRLRRKAR